MHSSVRKVASFEPVSWHLGEDATRQRSSGSIQSHGIINRLRSYTVKACTLYIKDHTVRIHWVLGNFFFRERYLYIINVSPTRKKQQRDHCRKIWFGCTESWEIYKTKRSGFDLYNYCQWICYLPCRHGERVQKRGQTLKPRSFFLLPRHSFGMTNLFEWLKLLKREKKNI